VSVDLSNTYLDWAARNFELNGLSTASHQLVSADCRTWLAEAASARALFDLIYLDPPTFSNSKRMSGVLDTQRDHAELIEQCFKLLAPDGLLVFSTNAQRFELAPQIAVQAEVRDITRATIGFDYERNAHIHSPLLRDPATADVGRLLCLSVLLGLLSLLAVALLADQGVRGPDPRGLGLLGLLNFAGADCRSGRSGLCQSTAGQHAQ